MDWSRRLVLVTLFLSFFFSLHQCPYSKVEESFQLQATHDLFYHGLGTAVSSLRNDGSPLPFDHVQFPGVVPRTFMGPLILSTVCQLLRWILLPVIDIGEYPNFIQTLSRIVLMLFTLHGFHRLAKAIDKRTHSLKTGSYLLLITASQFHVPFYASRMLPNTFAMIVCMHCYAHWIEGNIATAAKFLVTATVTFRCDMLLLLFTVGLTWLIRKELGFFQAIRIGIATGLVNLLVTVPLDSLLWQRWVWPEGQVFYFNTVLNKSSEWGVSAWHWYWTNALPKALLFTAALVPFSVIQLPEKLSYWERSWRSSVKTKGKVDFVDSSWLPFLFPTLGFVALYSCLGHKEVRFLFPVIPLLNLFAATGLVRFHDAAQSAKDKKPAMISKLFFAGAWLTLPMTLFCSTVFVMVSSRNYPGGVAIDLLGKHLNETGPIPVYVDVGAAMTGVSLFGQHALQQQCKDCMFEFVKAGYEEENSLAGNLTAFLYLLVEDTDELLEEFEIVAPIPGNPRLNFRELRIDTTDALYIMKRGTKSQAGMDGS